MYELDDVVFAVFIGFIPTASMLFASFALYNFAVSSLIEASCQNFTSGLIIAAVAQELFPLMNPPKRDPNAVNLESGLPLDAQYFIGTTLGFVMGVAMINGVAQIIEVLENAGDGGTNLQGYFSELLSSFKEKAMENWRKMKMIFSGPGGYDDIPDGSSQRRKNSIFIAGQLSPEMQAQLTATYKSMSNPSSPAPADLESNSSPPPSTEDNVRESKLDDDDDDGETSSYDRAAVRTAAAAIASPQHRNRIKTIFLEIMTSVDSLEKMSMHLAHDRNGVLALLERESREELIDQEVHQLQYRLDHARRLLQGSESDLSASPKSSRPRVSPNSSQKWVEKRDRIEEILTALKTMAFHLLEHLEPGAEIGIPVLRELHEHVEEMDSNIAELHKTTEDASFKWRKLAKLVIPAKGSFVPPSLILPVIIDGFVDGFLIGVACSLSRSAGCILAIANCLEMAFLGMAVAMRVRKCTGSSALVRTMAMIVPPLFMWGAAVLGAFVGSSSKAYPMLFVGFVAFGIIALLYLVIHELLAEAREAMEGKELWWVNCIVFLGIWIVLLIDRIVGE